MRRPIPFALWVVFGLLLDQASKAAVLARIPEGSSWSLWPGLLHFTPARNRGVAFSLFKDHPALILAVAVLAVGILAVWYVKSWRAAPPALIVVQGLLLVGASGNLVDRLWLGTVRDFIDFRPELPWIGHWATFNLADACICVGVALFVWIEFRHGGEESGKAEAKVQEPGARSQEPGAGS